MTDDVPDFPCSMFKTNDFRRSNSESTFFLREESGTKLTLKASSSPMSSNPWSSVSLQNVRGNFEHELVWRAIIPAANVEIKQAQS